MKTFGRVIFGAPFHAMPPPDGAESNPRSESIIRTTANLSVQLSSRHECKPAVENKTAKALCLVIIYMTSNIKAGYGAL